MHGDTLVSVDLNGDADVLMLPPNMPRIAHAEWSPAGDRIGVLARDEREGGSVLVFDPDDPGQPAEQLVPPTADTSGTGSVVQFAWLPNGSGLAYLMADEQRGPAHGGSIYIHDERTGQRRLVATPGRGGPAAQIVDFEVSPDGKAISYVIATPEGDAWQFNSLWIRSLKGSQALSVPVSDTRPVTDMWWVDSGLAWAQAGETVRIDIVDAATGTRTLLDTAPLASATPVTGATPEASPLTTSAGLGATPGAATPAVATPVSGTPAAATPAGTPALATPRS
jgi:dipeptidyl aminopeptidase/acylaminoacyl peptidase